MKNSYGHRQLRPTDPKKTLLRLFGYFRYNRLLFIGGIFFIIISTIAQVAANGMLSPIIDSLVEHRAKSIIIRYLLIMGALVILISIGEYFGSLFMARLAQRTVHRIREDMFSHMEKLPISYFDSHTHGNLMSTFTNDVDMLNQSLEQSVSQITISVITVVGTFIMMLILSPILTLVVIAMLVIMLLFVRYVGQKSARNFRKQQAALADMNGYIEEMMSGQKVVKVFNYEKRAIKDFSDRNEELRRASTSASTYGVMLMPIMGNLSYVLYALISMLGAYLAMAGRFSIGNIASYLQYTRTISRPITQVSNQLNTLFAALAGAERIFNVLEEEPETDQGDVRLVSVEGKPFWKVQRTAERDLHDTSISSISIIDRNLYGENEAGENISSGSVSEGYDTSEYDFIPLEGYIQFVDVDFGYLPEQKVLHRINLYAKPGQKIAFVGSTGAGKTTITNMINRFYEINDGTILYDGIDIKRINKYDLRNTMSIVLQDVHLFEGTVADNIRYGRLDATDAEVKEAAKLANAHCFIKNLPQGYDTMLTIDGQNLSQGERQLLSIARAAITNPAILILDEATSSVDTRTEKLIAEGMDKLMKGRTTFVIAHRLSTVRDSNAIMVLEHGEIIERGDHDDLMKQKGRYYALNTGAIELD